MIEKASPNAPSPSNQMRERFDVIAAPALGVHERHDRALGERDLVVAVGKLAEHPASEDLLDRAVEDPARESCVDVRAKLPGRLAARDDALEGGEDLADLVHALLHPRAARHLAYEHADEIGLAPPRPQAGSPSPDGAAPLPAPRFLDVADRLQQVRPRLAEDRLEDVLLRGEVVVDEPVRDACLLGDVADARRVVALPRERPHGGVEDLAPLLLRGD